MSKKDEKKKKKKKKNSSKNCNYRLSTRSGFGGNSGRWKKFRRGAAV